MGVREIEMFLTSLAVNTRASPVIQSICEFMLLRRYKQAYSFNVYPVDSLLYSLSSTAPPLAQGLTGGGAILNLFDHPSLMHESVGALK